MLSLVKKVIGEQLSLDESEVAAINENSRLREDLNLDSLDAVEISMAIEDELEIEFDESELDEISTVADLVNIIQNKKA